MTRGLRSLLLCSIGFSALGCASKDGSVFEPFQYPQKPIQAAVGELRFHDDRAEIRRGTFDTPVLSMPGEEERAQVLVTTHDVEVDPGSKPVEHRRIFT